MFPSRRDMSNSSISSLLIKAKRFGIFSVFAITANVFTIPQAAYSQIAVDGSTATEVNGNVISPTGTGTVNGGNLYNSFNQFNVPNTGVIFNTGTSSVDGNKVNNIINRVTGDSPSSILGTIQSRQAFPNANLFLLNPNGVIFSPNAKLDIGGSFNVSTGTGLGFDQNQKFTVDKNSLSFPSGDPKNIQFAISQPAAIINQGNLSVDAGKNIAITAGTVINTGSLSAAQGNINIAAVEGNSQVELRSPDLVLGLSVSKNTVPTTWNGQIATLSKLAEALTGKVEQANQVVVKPDGSIALVASPVTTDIAVKEGMAIASGNINVSSESGKGGNIGIFGNQVGLVNAQINASGATGGGTVLIGGDFQGKGTAPNALQTYIDSSSKILASGLLTGDGGRVIVWADQSTQFLGAIAARGGEISGNGGFVEVSGKENLSYQGDTDTRATNGTTGTLLLDPTNIIVVGSGANSLSEISIFNNNPAIGTATISNSLINAANSNVILQATQNITFGNAINITNSGISLTAQAGNSIFVGSSITTNGGGVNLIGNDPSSGNPTGLGNITINAPITTNGGAINVQLVGAGQLSVNGNLTSGNGNINLTGNSISSDGISVGGFNTQISSGSGKITINGSTSAANASANGFFVSGTGSVDISSTSGDISITGNSTSTLGGDGLLISGVFSGNSTTIQTANGNISFTGNATNPSRLGINIRPPSGGNLNVDSGAGNLSFISDKSAFPNISFGGSGIITLQPLSNSASLVIDTSVTNVTGALTNVFLDSSFVSSLFNSTGFSNVVIGNSVSNNAISLNNNLFIGTSNSTPITIQTANTFNAAGFAINTAGNFILDANQGISNLGNVVNSNGSIAIASSLGGIASVLGTSIDANGSLVLTADQNISTANLSSSGGAIAITSNSGSIDTSAGFIDSSLSGFSGGAIALTALGNITTAGIASSASNGSGGAISIISTGLNGAIAVNGVLDSFSTNNGTGGNILLQSAGNITTNDLILSAASNGNAGNISYISTGGSITANQRVRSSSAGTTLINGNGGNILFQAAGNIITNEIISSATGAGSGGNINVIAGGGAITTNGNVTSSASNASSGDGGDILLQANGDILVTGNINPSANVSPAFGTEGQISITSDTGSLNLQNLGNSKSVTLLAQQNINTGNINVLGTGDISIISNAGSINTSLGTVSNFADGDSGDITFLAFGDITTSVIDSFSTFGKPGSISLTSTTGSIRLGGDISTTSLFGTNANVNNVGNITLTGNVSLLTDVILVSEDDGIGGNINLANANITGNQSLVIVAGSGNVSLGAIGTSVDPLASLLIFNSGNTILNADVFTVGNLTFDSPVTLANNVAIATSGNTINFNSTINGNRSLSLDAADNSIFFNGLVGNINPLASLTIDSRLQSTSEINVRALGDISTRAIGSFLSLVNVDIQTAGAFTPNGNTIISSSLNLSANQGINNLGNITTSGGNITISSTLGSINSAPNTTIDSSPPVGSDLSGGDITITANNSFLNLQNLKSTTSPESPISANAGNITLNSAGDVSVRNIFANAEGLSTGNANAGTLSINAGSNSNINITGNIIDLSSISGNSSNLTFLRPVVINNSAAGSALFIDTTGVTANGSVSFSNTITSPVSSALDITTGSGNVTFSNAIASSSQPLGNFTVNSSGTTTFASTVFANSISSDFGGNTIINADLVATGINGFINLGNFTANGTISLVGNEIDLNGIASGTGDLTLKPLTTTQTIAIGSSEDTGVSTLNILNSDLSAFVNGTFNSLTIGNLNGSGAVFLLGNVNLFQPTTIQSPIGNGSFNSNGFDITGVGRLGIEVGNSIVIGANSVISPTTGNQLNVVLNSDRDVTNGGTITINSNARILSNGGNITLGGGADPITVPAISLGGNAPAIAIGNAILNASGGDISVRGLKNATFGANNTGIQIISGSRLLTSGAGTINLVGASSTTGTASNIGIRVDNASLIQSANGNISLQGTGGSGSGANDIGVAIANGAIVRSTGAGNLSFIGDTISNIASSQDISIVDSTLETLGSGNISLASVQTSPQAIRLTNSLINPTLVGGIGNITFESDGIDLLGTTQVRGTGNLILQPSSVTTGITLGGSVGSPNVDLFSSEIATLRDGFSQIFIGRTDTSGLIVLASDVIFSDPVTLRSQGIGGSINTSGFNFTSTGAINFLANQNITTNNITALGNNLTLSSSLGAINTSQGLLNTSSTSGNGGNISLLSPSINTNLGSINTSSTIGNAGNLSFANISNGLITIAGSDINLSSGSGLAGSLNFLAPVVINSPNLTVNTSSTGTSGDVTFSNTLNGAIANANSLLVNAGSGNITFNAIGNNIALNFLTANTTGITRFNSIANLASLTTNAGGTTQLNGIINTSGTQTYNDAVTLIGASQLNATNSAVLFSNTVDGTQNLIVNTGSGNITFNGAVGSSTILGNLTANSAGTTRFNTVNAASLLTNAGGTTELNGNITTTGAVTFNDAVILTGATQLNSVNTAIAFNASVNGNQNLIVNSGGGNISFNDDVGNTTPIGNLTANSSGVTRFNRVNAASLTTDATGTTQLNGNIATTGSQTYNDAVILNNSIQLNTTNSAFTFNNTVNSNQDLAINTGVGNINFSSPVTVRNLTTNSTGITRIDSNINAVSFETAFGGSTLLLGNVFTSGNQTYNNNLLISANTILDSSSGNGDIRFTTINNAIAGTPSNLILNVGTGSIFFNNSVGSLSDRLGDITISNANEFISSGIIAKSLTQNAGTGETQLGNDNEFTGNLNITSQRFSLTEAANLRVGNATIQAVNGVSLAVASNFSLLGSGSINIDSDSNSDSIGTFLNRGTITDNGFGGVVNIRTADPDIRSAIIASQITLTPSVTNTSIAIGSVANGNFKLQDSTLGLLQANLVTIRANGSPVSIGSNNASFATGTSLEIGTASSPASSISAIAGFTLNVDRNLSLTGNTIQLGETNVGGNLALRFTESVSQVGTISVTGSTNLIVDTNPLTNILLADFANNFGSQTSFTFINLPNDDFQNFEIRDIAEGATIALFPNQVNNLKLILDNGTIDLPTIPLTGSLTLKAREVSLNGDITTTNASLSGGRINLNRNLTTSGNLIIDNADTLKIGTDTNLDVTGNFEQIGSGSVQLGGNIVSAASVTFAQDIELIGDSSITSDGDINFDGTVNGLFGFTLDASGNFVVTTGGFGTTSPLQSLAIAPDSTLVSGLNSGFSTADINISTIGDVSVGSIINNGRGININSADGLITTANIDSSFTISFGNGGNVNLSAEGDVIIGNINTSSFGDAGEVNLESRSGVISTGNIDASGISGGRVFFNAATAINAGQITTRGFEGAGGDVILDPSGDVVVASIETTGLTGGNVTLVSTGGNLKITDILNSSNSLSACAGASICTIGSISSGTISLQTGGLNPFVVGDSSINGSSGVLTTGQSTLTLGTSIPVLLNSTFVQNGISISPGGFTDDPNNGLEPPKNISNIINQAPVEEKILSVRDVFISEADRYFREGNLEKAFEVIEQAYVSELEIFTGRAIDSEAITIENTQDLLSTVIQRTGDVATLIYPVILNDRIEILVIPPKEKGKPFRRTSIAINSEKIEAIVTDYRNNLRDVGSNDYLEQSQQLYDLVIRPIKQQLEAMKVDTLVFVMDGVLRVTPPAALHDGKQFLIERYAIASIPALRVTRVEERDRKATRVLAMGLTESVAGFSALPSVDVEIKIISSSVLNGDAFLNQEFTVNNLQSQRQRGIYNILHLGTHAKFVSDTSKDSFIQFWDSRLSLRDIPKLRFDSPVIDMLALSACQTAVGNNLGISGLAVESGARSVLASLWEVSDTGTAPLMISFYKAFPDAVNKAQAMKKAQIELLEGRVSVGNSQILGIEGIPNIPLPPGLDDIDLKHPFYWSSFILVGNWL